MGISFISKKGETSLRLSSYYYGDWVLFGLIEDINPNSFENHISIPFKRIFIPDVFTEEIEHTIEKEDTYYSLSQKYYNTERYFNLIQAKNNSMILKYNVGGLVIIPPLINREVYKKAPRWQK